MYLRNVKVEFGLRLGSGILKGSLGLGLGILLGFGNVWVIVEIFVGLRVTVSFKTIITPNRNHYPLNFHVTLLLHYGCVRPYLHHFCPFTSAMVDVDHTINHHSIV